MALSTNVIKRPGSSNYYLRAVVPLDVQQAFGKREVWKSLGTADPAEAKRRARSELEKLDREWQAIRSDATIDPSDIEQAVWARYIEIIEGDERFRSTVPNEDELDEIWRHIVREYGDHDLEGFRILQALKERAVEDRRKRETRLATLKKAAANNDPKPVADVAASVLPNRGKHVDKSSSAYKRLTNGLARAEIEALKRAAERDRGDFSGQPRDPIVQPPRQRHIAVPGETLPELFERYRVENNNDVKEDTLNQTQQAIELLVEMVGRNFAVNRLDKKTVSRWKSLLIKYPVKARDSKVFAGMDLEHIVVKNENIGKQTITKKTVNRYLSGLGAFCKWLVVNDFLTSNPVDGLYFRLEKKSKRRPFTIQELNTLFSKAFLFNGCASQYSLGEPGNARIRDHRYWLPLVMLYSGCRPAEIAQLAVGDVRQDHSHWIMHVTDTDDEQSVKTNGSRRVVPIHPELVKLGFIDFCQTQKGNGSSRVFPEAIRNSRGQIAASFSRNFTRVVLKTISLERSGELSLYSFRHGFVDALRRAGYLDDQFGFLIGHAKATTTGLYGVLPQGILQQRVDMISSVKYDGLDLRHMYMKP